MNIEHQLPTCSCSFTKLARMLAISVSRCLLADTTLSSYSRMLLMPSFFENDANTLSSICKVNAAWWPSLRGFQGQLRSHLIDIVADGGHFRFGFCQGLFFLFAKGVVTKEHWAEV